MCRSQSREKWDGGEQWDSLPWQRSPPPQFKANARRWSKTPFLCLKRFFFVWFFIFCDVAFANNNKHNASEFLPTKKNRLSFFFNVLSKEARAAVAKTIKLKAAANGEAINHTWHLMSPPSSPHPHHRRRGPRQITWQGSPPIWRAQISGLVFGRGAVFCLRWFVTFRAGWLARTADERFCVANY